MSNGKCSVLIFFSTTTRNRSLQTETWVLKVQLSEELWAADLNNTQKQLDFSFYNGTRTSQLQWVWTHEKMTSLKQDLEKLGWPQGQGSTLAWWGLQSVVRSWRECVCVRTCVCVHAHMCVCVYTDIYIYK